MDRISGLALILIILVCMVCCRQPLDRPACRPLRVESNGLRADWFYRDRSEQPRSIEVYDSTGLLVVQTRFRYENNRLIERETRLVGGQPLERIRYAYDEAGRISLRERWPQRSGNFDESYARERRAYNTDGQLSERIWIIDRTEHGLTARTEHLTYDAAGQLLGSELYRDNRQDAESRLYSYEYQPTTIPNVLGSLWADEPTWALSNHLPAQVTARFRNGQIDSTASCVFFYRLDAQGLPVEVEKKILRGKAQSWRIRYSCR